MQFERIPIILKRYDFASKMAICQKYSSDTMSTNGLTEISELIKKVLPWEIETFALFSVITLNEYSDLSFDNKRGINRFSEIISCIRNYQHPTLWKAKDNQKFVDYFMVVTGLNQFQLQEDIYFKIYRYKYFFNFKNNKVDMNEHFLEQFESTYEEFVFCNRKVQNNAMTFAECCHP